MASTSVHLPPAMVEGLDRIAARQGTSRNRIIVQACANLLAAEPGEWPDGFFDAHLSRAELATLRSAARDLEHSIYANRRDRPVPPL